MSKFSKQELNILKEAFDQYIKEFCETLPTDEELKHITFSEEFETKMQRLIAKEKKFYYYWINTVGKRVAAIIFAILIGLTTITVSVKAIREPFIQFIVETYEKFSNVIFNDENDDNSSDNQTIIFEKIVPDYIPEGYVKDIELEDASGYTVSYIGKDITDSIMYVQNIIDNAMMSVDTENIDYEKITINNIEAFYYSNKGVNTVMFSNGEYAFTISSAIEKDELIKIAESIKIH